MTRPSAASAAELQRALDELEGWALVEQRLCKQFEFASFPEAIDFISRVAVHAERLDHHPEWTNTYNRVEVALSTHTARAVTTLDFELARAMEAEARATAR